MIEFPPAKLNLGLQIIAKRTDGYHDLQTVFYQFPLNDVLEIIKDDSLEPGQCRLISSGLPIPGGENLCEKAYKLLHKSHTLPCLLYTSPSPRDGLLSRMPSSA